MFALFCLLGCIKAIETQSPAYLRSPPQENELEFIYFSLAVKFDAKKQPQCETLCRPAYPSDTLYLSSLTVA
ncbi:hypothetical protein F4680DRAFT_436817 [Xylaria scruposa]|nr:hypothetical protein F4680DRAFT_436817 [Xylaria scruposa]